MKSATTWEWLNWKGAAPVIVALIFGLLAINQTAFAQINKPKIIHDAECGWCIFQHLRIEFIADGNNKRHCMNFVVKLSLVPFFFFPLIAGWAGTQEESKVVEQSPVKTTEPWEITIGGPAWLAWAVGHSGFHGVNPYIQVGPGQLLKNINVVYATSGEVRKGRFGLNGGLLQLNAQAGTGERSGLVSKLDLGQQQYFGQLFASYRVIEGPRGWLDLLAGFRYTYLGEQVGGLQANNMAIGVASTRLIDQFAQQAAKPGSDVRTLVVRNITDQLGALDGRDPKLPGGPVAEGQKAVIANLVQQLLQSQQGPLADAIRAGAQARVNQLKAQLFR